MLFNIAGFSACTITTNPDLIVLIEALQEQNRLLTEQLNLLKNDINSNNADILEQINALQHQIIRLENELVALRSDTDPRRGFFTLSEAYRFGWLTRLDLKDIIYHFSDGVVQKENLEIIEHTPIPKVPEILAPSRERRLIQDWMEFVDTPADIEYLPYGIDGVSVVYKGTFNGNVAIKLTDRNAAFILSRTERVGGFIHRQVDFPHIIFLLWRDSSPLW